MKGAGEDASRSSSRSHVWSVSGRSAIYKGLLSPAVSAAPTLVSAEVTTSLELISASSDAPPLAKPDIARNGNVSSSKQAPQSQPRNDKSLRDDDANDEQGALPGSGGDALQKGASVSSAVKGGVPPSSAPSVSSTSKVTPAPSVFPAKKASASAATTKKKKQQVRTSNTSKGEQETCEANSSSAMEDWDFLTDQLREQPLQSQEVSAPTIGGPRKKKVRLQ